MDLERHRQEHAVPRGLVDVRVDGTPAAAAGIILPFENGWANLIEWATIYEARRRLGASGFI